MAYNPRNLLMKVEKVQELYHTHKEDGITNRYIWRKYVAPVYYISERTFYDWLSINVKLRRKQLEDKSRQMRLF